MRGESPIEDERDLDRWVQEVTDDWQMPVLAAGQTTWQRRVDRPEAGRQRVYRLTLRMGAGVAGAAATVVVAVLVLSSLSITQHSGSAVPGPSGEAQDQVFAVTIAADKAIYAANEPILITSELQYVGSAPETTVRGFYGGIVGFGIEQLDGPVDKGIGRRYACAEYHFQTGDLQKVPFAKSGVFLGNDPLAAFWKTFLADPQLRLPSGHYRISAEAAYGAPGCGQNHTLTASVLIVVQ